MTLQMIMPTKDWNILVIFFFSASTLAYQGGGDKIIIFTWFIQAYTISNKNSNRTCAENI